jgi:hypothetical protein
MKVIPKLTESDLKRFWSKVDKRGPDDCWEWTASLDISQRGLFRLQGGLYKAPRVTYFLHTSCIPELTQETSMFVTLVITPHVVILNIFGLEPGRECTRP